ncbi:unnamed protein product [Rhodiola kirilowii]
MKEGAMVFHPLLLNINHPRLIIGCNLAISQHSAAAIFSPLLVPRPRIRTSSLCLKHSGTQHPSEKSDGFSGIPRDVPFDKENLWSNFSLYLFSVHVPMSFGGLSTVAYVMNLTYLDPQMELFYITNSAILSSLLLSDPSTAYRYLSEHMNLYHSLSQALLQLTIQTLELIIVLSLLDYATKPESGALSFLKSSKLSSQRKWWLASSVGFVVLILLIFLTSIVEDVLFGPKAANKAILKEILQSSDITKTACFLAYCVIIPLLEEIVYRGYLLSTLASKTKWQYAVLMSSLVFSAAHFSIDDAFQLFVIGCILGCSYCWTGNLRTSILIHSMYNAVSLVITLVS